MEKIKRNLSLYYGTSLITCTLKLSNLHTFAIFELKCNKYILLLLQLRDDCVYKRLLHESIITKIHYFFLAQ